MCNDFKKGVKGKSLMAKMRSKKFLRNLKRRGFFYQREKSVKRTTPENLSVFFPIVNVGLVR